MSFDVCRVRLWRACAALVLLSANPASAQNFPDGPIRLVLPYPPGGSADFVARPISPRLSERLGQQVVIDNRGGAGGNIAMEIVARATPDGRTLILALGMPVVMLLLFGYGVSFAGFDPLIAQVAPDTWTALSLVAAEVGIHLTISSVAENTHTDGFSFLPVADPFDEVLLRMAWRADSLNPALATVLALADEVL